VYQAKWAALFADVLIPENVLIRNARAIPNQLDNFSFVTQL
jgi:hypothetical protein